jgi:hypothetical protein
VPSGGYRWKNRPHPDTPNSLKMADKQNFAGNRDIFHELNRTVFQPLPLFKSGE